MQCKLYNLFLCYAIDVIKLSLFELGTFFLFLIDNGFGFKNFVSQSFYRGAKKEK